MEVNRNETSRSTNSTRRLPEENRATEVETADERKIQEGDAPAETPQDLIAELGRVSVELLDLIKRINKTNSATPFAGRRNDFRCAGGA